MWELDCEEGCVLKYWCFWTVVLEKTLEGPLDCKEIQPVHAEGDQPWDFFGRNDAKAETPVLSPPHAKSWLIGKDWCWDGLGAGGEGDDLATVNSAAVNIGVHVLFQITVFSTMCPGVGLQYECVLIRILGLRDFKGNQPWIFMGRTDAVAEAPILLSPDVKSQLIGKDSDAGNEWEQDEKRATENEMVGWHHQLNGFEFEQTLGHSKGRGSLVCFSIWGCKESDTTEWLNNKVWLHQ